MLERMQVPGKLTSDQDILDSLVGLCLLVQKHAGIAGKAAARLIQPPSANLKC